MRGRLALLILTGALAAGCSSQGTVGAASHGPGCGFGLRGEHGFGRPGSTGAPTSGGPLPGLPRPPARSRRPAAVRCRARTRPWWSASARSRSPSTRTTAARRARRCTTSCSRSSTRSSAASIQVEYHAVDLVDHSTGGKGSRPPPTPPAVPSRPRSSSPTQALSPRSPTRRRRLRPASQADQCRPERSRPGQPDVQGLRPHAPSPARSRTPTPRSSPRTRCRGSRRC